MAAKINLSSTRKSIASAIPRTSRNRHDQRLRGGCFTDLGRPVGHELRRNHRRTRAFSVAGSENLVLTPDSHRQPYDCGSPCPFRDTTCPPSLRLVLPELTPNQFAQGAVDG